mgnify:CR=1 FL=1
MKWSIYNELLYSRYVAEGSSEFTTDEGAIVNSEMEIGGAYLKGSTLIRYKYPISKANWFLNSGVSYGILVGNTNERTVNRFFFGEQEPIETFALDRLRDYEVGISVGTGLILDRYSVETRFENTTGISNVGSKSRVNRLLFLIGYKF